MDNLKNKNVQCLSFDFIVSTVAFEVEKSKIKTTQWEENTKQKTDSPRRKRKFSEIACNQNVSPNRT